MFNKISIRKDASMTISYEKSRTTDTFVILDSSLTLVSELFKDGLLLLAVKGSVIAE